MNRTIHVPKPAVVGLITAEMISAALAWRDLGRRTEDQVGGTKTGWRLFITLNPRQLTRLLGRRGR